MQEIRFRLRHGCAFGRLSDRFPNVAFSNWCNFALEVLEFPAKNPALAEEVRAFIASTWKRGIRTIGTDAYTGVARAVLHRRGHERGSSVDDLLEDHGCLVLYPVLHKAGWEEYRIVAMDDAELKPLFQKLANLGELHIDSKHRAGGGFLSDSLLVPTGELFRDLTPKQAEALLAAIEGGYYHTPRRTRAQDIATARHIPRTTFEEHVRKGEGKVLRAIAPYLPLFLGSRR